MKAVLCDWICASRRCRMIEYVLTEALLYDSHIDLPDDVGLDHHVHV